MVKLIVLLVLAGGFLIAATAEGSSFGYSNCWFDFCVEWQSQYYDRSLGRPLGPPEGTQPSADGVPMHWTRAWEGVEVELDCEAYSVSFQWN